MFVQLILTILFVFAVVGAVMGLAYWIDSDANRHDSVNGW